MSKVLFKRVDYKLDNLIMDIESGRLGLPDIQRPFVWPATKVRELLDSMLRGYPIGFILLWDSPFEDNKSKQIGATAHSHESPKQLIIDGQQRLTSLYAVFRGIEVYDKKFERKPIKIAFSPLHRKFEVATVVHKRSPEWIENVSDAFNNSSDAFNYINDFLTKLGEARQKEDGVVTIEERKAIGNNMNDLFQLKDYSIPALDISEHADEEAVAEIFVRVNAGGISLNENDFILTLISVYDEAERAKIERFCYEATIPVAGGTSYNQIIKPKPAHIIRVVMGFGFKRARLKYAYMLLRGRDFDKGIYTPELRELRFAELKQNLNSVLNLENWHEFLKCVASAGYLSNSLISSENTLVYSYVIYLIGKYDYKIGFSDLRKLVAKWFYMCSVTGYFTGSPETRMEQVLADLRGVSNKEGFSKFVLDKIDSSFTSDYFSITLPASLATSSANSNAWYAYCAALNILDAKALFSNLHIRDLFSPGASGIKSSVEKHHLFPKSYLSIIGIGDDRDRNQIANYAYIEWKNNIEISDGAPSEYLPKQISDLSDQEIVEMNHSHALADNWIEMDYLYFLEDRRRKMAQVIRQGYSKI